MVNEMRVIQKHIQTIWPKHYKCKFNPHSTFFFSALGLFSFVWIFQFFVIPKFIAMYMHQTDKCHACDMIFFFLRSSISIFNLFFSFDSEPVCVTFFCFLLISRENRSQQNDKHQQLIFKIEMNEIKKLPSISISNDHQHSI